MKEFLSQSYVQEFMSTLITGVLTLLAGFLIALVKKGFDWLSAKIDLISNEKLRAEVSDASVLLENAVINTVTSLQQTVGDDIKKSIKLNDGQYTRDDLLALKDTALKTVKDQLGDSVLEILNRVYSNLDSVIADMIEAQVKSLKENNPSVKTLLG